MTVKDSRLKSGTLTLDTKAFACQATNVTITPAHDTEGDPVETLCGDTLPAARKRTDVLGIVAVQDFDDPAGFVAMSWTKDLQTVPFSWSPSGATGPTYTGQVEILALPVGGDVGSRLTTEAEWSVVGAVTVTYPTQPAAGDEPADAAEPADASA